MNEENIKKGENLRKDIKEDEMSLEKIRRNLRIIALFLILVGGWRFFEKDVLLGFILFIIAGIIYIFQKEFAKMLK